MRLCWIAALHLSLVESTLPKWLTYSLSHGAGTAHQGI